MLAAILLTLELLAGGQAPEHVVDIQIHGNTLTPDAEILAVAGVQIGMPVDAGTIDAVADRLRSSHRFQHVDVLKRFASIDDSSQIALVIVVDEGRVVIRDDGGIDRDGSSVIAGVVKRRSWPIMIAPVIDFEDGYGLAYGARFAWPEPFGAGSRISFPATWGGEKRVGAQFDQDMRSGPVSRVQMGADLVRRKQPFFDENDDRQRAWGRVERDVWRSVRVGAALEGQHVSFLGATDRFVRVGTDVVVDTRIDPMLARNAIYARAAVDRLSFVSTSSATRTEIDTRGYLALPGQGVLVLRAQRLDSDRPLALYLKPLLGGTASLRGFEAGSFIGDTLVGSSAEIRIPFTSPLSVAKIGVSTFMDVAAIYNKGQSVHDQVFKQGVGAGVWAAAAVIRLNLSVAHGKHGSTRIHFGMSLLF